MTDLPIRAWREQGIPGGWTLHYDAVSRQGQGKPLKLTAKGDTPQKAVAAIFEILANNDCSDLESDVWAVALNQWFERLIQNGQRHRILGPYQNFTVQRDLSLDDYGQHVWAYHHILFGSLEWNPLNDAQKIFEWSIRAVIALLETPGIGCPECARHFHAFCDTHSYKRVSCQEEAAVWWFLAHNAANQHKGAPPLSYDQAAHQWAMIPLPNDRLHQIITKLKA